MSFDFLTVAAFLGLGMLLWNCFEVGRNDAANLVNAVYGARVMTRQRAVWIAALFVVLGATAASAVMDTARQGIFDPTTLTFRSAMTIYISVYLVNTVLLYGFSGFGMPVSTTATLVFSLLGASLFLSGPDAVKWGSAGTVVSGIFVSIAISGIAAFLVMRVFRGAIGDKAQDRDTVLLHGPWIAGAMLTWLIWFMVFKGMKNVSFVGSIREETFGHFGVPVVLLMCWALLTFLVHAALAMSKGRLHPYLFHFTAVLGMICMAFAFGQNDLANAASPGLSGFWLWQNRETTTAIATGVSIPVATLFLCGAVIASGMFTSYAQRVTRAEVNTGSQYDQVALYAPKWCRALARVFLRTRAELPVLAPPPTRTEDPSHKKIHYDTLRASVIMSVSASVIAFASGMGLPISTTYVAFAAVVGTGFSDRVFARGDADRKIGRAIWVVTCWLISPLISIVGAGLAALLVYRFGVGGLLVGLAANLTVRVLLKRRADRHEELYHKAISRKDAGPDQPGPPPHKEEEAFV